MVGGLIIIAVFAAFAFGFEYFFNLREEADREVRILEAELATKAPLGNELSAQQARLHIYNEVLHHFQAIEIALSYVNFFTAEDARAIIASMPTGVELESFRVAHTALELTGELDSMATLASLMENLEATGLFGSVTPARAVSDVGVIRFAIECTFLGVALR